jgi:hypothetical protein
VAAVVEAVQAAAVAVQVVPVQVVLEADMEAPEVV